MIDLTQPYTRRIDSSTPRGICKYSSHDWYSFLTTILFYHILTLYMGMTGFFYMGIDYTIPYSQPIYEPLFPYSGSVIDSLHLYTSLPIQEVEDMMKPQWQRTIITNLRLEFNGYRSLWE